MLVCIEGIDGAGKTTVTRVLQERLSTVRPAVEFAQHNSFRAASPYADMQLRSLQKLKRGSAESAYSEVCDLYWVLLWASYYALVDQHVLTPTLRERKSLIVDGWFYKFAARIASSGPTRMNDVLRYFRDIRTPDRTFLLDVEPHLAAHRLGTFNGGELGRANAGRPRTAEAFTEYQSRVRGHLIDAADSNGWTILETSHKSPAEIADHIIDSLGSNPWK